MAGGWGGGVSLVRNFGVALYSGLQIDDGELLARAVNIIMVIILQNVVSYNTNLRSHIYC